jgi:hypothetical protein
MCSISPLVAFAIGAFLAESSCTAREPMDKLQNCAENRSTYGLRSDKFRFIHFVCGGIHFASGLLFLSL